MNLTESKKMDNHMIALVVFIGAEIMFFTGLLGAFIYLRFSETIWPPFGQPMLPISITWINTIALLTSVYTMHKAVKSSKQIDQRRTQFYLALTCCLGMMFLIVQGWEWVKLIQHGMTIKHTYGGTFVLLVGCHALHIIGAVAWLLLSVFKRSQHSLKLCSIYWHFVSILWIFIFVPVYLI